MQLVAAGAAFQGGRQGNACFIADFLRRQQQGLPVLLQRIAVGRIFLSIQLAGHCQIGEPQFLPPGSFFFQHEAVERVHLVKPVAADDIPALDDGLDKVGLRRRIGILTLLHRGLDLLVAEGHHDLGAPKAVAVGQQLERRIGLDKFILLGMKSFAGKIADRRIIHFPVFFPGTHVQTQGEGIEADLVGIETVLIADITGHRLIAVAAQSRAKVDQVMAHVAFRGIDVQRVVRLGIEVIQPGGNHPQPAQLPAVLVGDEVVGIVFPPTLIIERPQKGFGLQKFTGRRPDAPVGQLMDLAQQPGKILLVKRPLPPQRIGKGDIIPQAQDGGIEKHHKIFRHIIAGSVKQFGGHHFRSGRHLGISRGLKLDHVALPFTVLDVKSRGNPLHLHADDGPGTTGVGAHLAAIGTGGDLFRGHRVEMVAVGKPTVVIDLVKGVDVVGFFFLAEEIAELPGKVE